MTNLTRWLTYMSLFAIPYFAVILEKVQSPFLTKFMFEIQCLPFVLVILFGIYSAGIILYRTFTFNDCPEAEKELQLEIIEARKDLISKGFKFRD